MLVAIKRACQDLTIEAWEVVLRLGPRAWTNPFVGAISAPRTLACQETHARQCGLNITARDLVGITYLPLPAWYLWSPAGQLLIQGIFSHFQVSWFGKVNLH